MDTEEFGEILAGFLVVILFLGAIVGTVAMLRHGIVCSREADADIRTPMIKAQNSVTTEEMAVYLQATVDGMNKQKYNESDYKYTPDIYRALVAMNEDLKANPAEADKIQFYLRSTIIPTTDENSHRYGSYFAIGLILAIALIVVLSVSLVAVLID